MAAKGYQEAFRRVKQSVARVLQGEKADLVLRQDYQDWYRGLFSESVRAGLLEIYHLAGHRSGPALISCITPCATAARSGQRLDDGPS